MTWLISFIFVIHRHGCEIEFNCEKCESNIELSLAIVTDFIAVAAFAFYLFGGK